jgi:hypothetical protein
VFCVGVLCWDEQSAIRDGSVEVRQLGSATSHGTEYIQQRTFGSNRLHVVLREGYNTRTGSAIASVKALKEVHQKPLENVAKAGSRSISHVDKKLQIAPLLKEGDKVYLLTKNLCTWRPRKKPNKINVGPSFISE